MLIYYQLRNLIQVYTQILKYLLCFQKPQDQKTSSSDLHSQKSKLSKTQDLDVTETVDSSQHSGESQQYFLVRRQKHCNFCGNTLSQPEKVTLSRKCPNCSQKNSCLVLPARFLCNMCCQEHSSRLYRCPPEKMIPPHCLDRFGTEMN